MARNLEISDAFAVWDSVADSLPAGSAGTAEAAHTEAAKKKDEDLRTIARLGAQRGSERDPGDCHTNSSDDMQAVGEVTYLAECLRQRERDRLIDIDQQMLLLQLVARGVEPARDSLPFAKASACCGEVENADMESAALVQCSCRLGRARCSSWCRRGRQPG